MKYKTNGKRSRAWWLQAVKWFGRDGNKGIMRGGEVPTHQVKEAVTDLIEEGYVTRSGGGRGKRDLAYALTELGSRYLDRNQDELTEAPESHDEPAPAPEVEPTEPPLIETSMSLSNSPPAADVYTWKQPVTGPTRFYVNGDFTLETKVPADEMARMQAEIEASRHRPDVKAGFGVGEHHEVPAGPVWKGPPMPIAEAAAPRRGRPPRKLENDVIYCGVPDGDDPKKYEHQHPMCPADKCPDRIKVETARERADRGIAIAKHVATNGGVPVDDVQHIDVAVGAEAARINKEQGSEKPRINRQPPTPKQLYDAKRREFGSIYRDVLVEILLEKYADQVTAKEVMDKINAAMIGLGEES